MDDFAAIIEFKAGCDRGKVKNLKVRQHASDRADPPPLDQILERQRVNAALRRREQDALAAALTG